VEFARAEMTWPARGPKRVALAAAPVKGTKQLDRLDAANRVSGARAD